jgi:ubiquinone/menaquinone biosynthesis C-methylase UbiE
MASSFSASPAHEIEDSEHWLSARDFVAQLDLRPGMTVADIGAGIASYALPIGRRVGPAGKVFAVEWRPWMMETLQARIAGPDSPGNIQVITGRAAECNLPDASCDLVIFADIWHEFEHYGMVLDEAGRILRQDGHLAILNWRPDALSPPGPPVEHRVSMQKAICTVEMKSWSLVKSADIGAHGYLLVFEKTDESVQS